jgi:hypothetical protein
MKTVAALPALALFVLAACGPSSGGDPGVASDPIGVPSAPDGEVMTPQPLTVLDDGDGARLCLGAVLESYPPQCGGPLLGGWGWDAYGGHYEEANGVRWGEFHVVGRYDGGGWDGTIEVSAVTPAADWDGERPPYQETSFDTPCPEPDGGWQVLDPDTTTHEHLDRAVAAAEGLDGYAGLWLDQSPNPAHARAQEPDVDWTDDAEYAMNDPMLLILNVQVTGDVAAAESALREVWGGMLCVSEAGRTEAELHAIQEAVGDTPDQLGAWSDSRTGQVHLEVMYDDGTLQATLDEEYGDGVVRVHSALVPAT